ncbi:hypothetical protein BT63DRAFT_316105 [Microthyrium microscopicum]|uniref:Zn(2)-C6 fungal-type domain-containing protein n=1 Tax=Microthyrium microscopicum TaxID=703497 RepID=A0A6A6U470_9PEZI|nr:hypothetical protein BT63DRAFT_316105 [Microthyrium microscopicum]
MKHMLSRVSQDVTPASFSALSEEVRLAEMSESKRLRQTYGSKAYELLFKAAEDVIEVQSYIQELASSYPQLVPSESVQLGEMVPSSSAAPEPRAASTQSISYDLEEVAIVPQRRSGRGGRGSTRSHTEPLKPVPRIISAPPPPEENPSAEDARKRKAKEKRPQQATVEDENADEETEGDASAAGIEFEENYSGLEIDLADLPPLRVSRPIAACRRCRDDGIKCDGKLPACSACERSGHADQCLRNNTQSAPGMESAVPYSLSEEIVVEQPITVEYSDSVPVLESSDEPGASLQRSRTRDDIVDELLARWTNLDNNAMHITGPFAPSNWSQEHMGRSTDPVDGLKVPGYYPPDDLAETPSISPGLSDPFE